MRDSIIWTGTTEIFLGNKDRNGNTIELSVMPWINHFIARDNISALIKLDPHYFDIIAPPITQVMLKMIKSGKYELKDTANNNTIEYEQFRLLSPPLDTFTMADASTVLTWSGGGRFIENLEGCFVNLQLRLNDAGQMQTKILEITPAVLLNHQNQLVIGGIPADSSEENYKLHRLCRIPLNNDFDSVYPLNNPTISLMYHSKASIKLISSNISHDSLSICKLFHINDSISYELNEPIINPFYHWTSIDYENDYKFPRQYLDKNRDPFVVTTDSFHYNDDTSITIPDHLPIYHTPFNERIYELSLAFYFNEKNLTLNCMLLAITPFIPSIDENGDIRGYMPCYMVRFIK